MQQSTQLIHLDPMDFSSYEEPPAPAAGHIHEAIEISTFEYGSATMLYGGRSVMVPENRLIVHWGMVFHQIVVRDPHTLVVGIHLPLSWFLQWNMPAALTNRLLNMELLIEPEQTAPCSDLALLKNWHRLLQQYGKMGRDIVLAEVRARLLRLALEHNELHETGISAAHHSAGSRFHLALEEITKHFREPLRIAQIAEKARVSPRHLARIFNENTGHTINHYLTQLRLSHVQRLLVTTDRTVTDIMYDSGFTCPTHFYKVFRNQTNCTPHQYRQQKD